jgi:hypothetical protein
MKLDLLTNAIVVDDAIRFVSDRANMKLKSFSSGSSNKSQKPNESKKADYNDNEYKGQLEKEPEDESGEVTVNQVF